MAVSSRTVNVRNILVGAGNMFIADLDTPLPTDVEPDTNDSTVRAEQAFIDDSDWSDVGATQEGVEVAYEPDIGEVEVDQMMDAAKLFNQGLQVQMNTQLAEATLENLMIAWGAPDDALDGDTFKIGSPGAEPVERSAAVVGLAPNTQATQVDQDSHRERIYLARRVISVEGSTHALRRTEATVFPVSFRLLPLPAPVDEMNPGSFEEGGFYTDSEYGVVVDRLYDANEVQ